jgi:hypothetical protein
MKPVLIFLSCILATSLANADDVKVAECEVANEKVKVFILAGQSNMQGQGVVDMDHPKYYNGGKGILKNVMKNPRRAKQYAHIQDKNGAWVVRDDVWVRFRVKSGIKAGPLTIGFTGYEGNHHIGPEFQFGHILGAAIKQQVLLIKTAWGGKSLYKDFRPPSAGGETGVYYTKMIQEIDEALGALPKEFPAYKNRGYEIAGFVWFQGWNDMYDEKARSEYRDNLVHLINDVRQVVKNSNLPVVIGELGNGGEKAGKNMLLIRQAQADAAKHKGFEKTVKFVKTTSFARPANESPNVGHGHHWFGNAESYFLVGDALGNAMVELLKR